MTGICEMTNYYSILELSDFAVSDDIKKAHRRLSKKYHPDLNPKDKIAEERFKIVQNAYEHLATREKKQLYDELLLQWYANQQSYNYHHYQSQQTYTDNVKHQQPPTKERVNYFPWSLAIMVLVWVLRAFSNNSSNELYSNVPVVIDYDTGSLQQTINMLHEMNNDSGALQTITDSKTADTVFTIGSSRDAVIAAQGYPFKYETLPPDGREVWHYDKSYIVLQQNFVSEFNNEDNNLHVMMQPTTALHNSTFGIGSSKDEVLAAQHTPTAINISAISSGELWMYGASSVVFKSNKVVSYINNGNLKVDK